MNSEQILALTDTCVKCGLCLPHCPTYRKAVQEADSPRGRIAIVQGLLNEQIPNTYSLNRRLSRCLECHACEAVCPSKVPVTHIIDATRAILTARQPRYKRSLRYFLLNLAVRPAILLPLVRYYQHSWLRLLIQRSGILKFLQLDNADNLLPEYPIREIRGGNFPALNAIQGSQYALRASAHPIAIFPGCIGRSIDANVINAAIKILTCFGYQVSVPNQPCCCGALHRHDGFAARGDLELANTVSLFKNYPHVLTLASACLAELRTSPDLSKTVVDANRFIADIAWPDDLVIDTTPQTIWVHTPCTQRHPVKDPQAAIDLLTHLPGVTPKPLPKNITCCGAAGTYMLKHQDISLSLLADKIQIIKDVKATIVVTTNTGCALRLKAGLRASNLEVRVCHPLEIVAELIKVTIL